MLRDASSLLISGTKDVFGFALYRLQLPTARKNVADLGSLHDAVALLAGEVMEFAEEFRSYARCEPHSSLVKTLGKIAACAKARMSRLHVLQMHAEHRSHSAIDKRHRVIFHDDLGQHRYDIIPALARHVAAQRYLEVGVFAGECAEAVVDASPGIETHLVDPFELAGNDYVDSIRQLFSLDQLRSNYDTVHDRFRDNPNVTIWPMTSRAAAAAGKLAGPFDLVFLDGDHSYAEALFDLQAWTPRVRPGGIVAIHDYSGDCLNCEYDVVRALHDYLPAGAEVHTAVDVLAWFQV